METFLTTVLDSTIDDTVRGVPPQREPVRLRDVGEKGWRPASGNMSLPVLTLDEAAFIHNTDLIFSYVKSHGVQLAPHAKTPMSPQIVARLMAAGAWGTTAANLQQASVLLRSGSTRLMIANEIGGRASGERLGDLLAAWPQAEVHLFCDSVDAVATASAAAGRAGRPVSVLVEVGGGRAGARDDQAVAAIISAVSADPGLVFGGVASYEGAVASSDQALTDSRIAILMARAKDAFAQVRALSPGRPLILTAGGSAFFDKVVAALKPVVDADGQAELVLRSGAIFFYDHGTYVRALEAMDQRGGFVVGGAARAAVTGFRPALRLWGEVLSRPEAGLAICGFGMRDVSYDQDLPIPLAAFRDGQPLAGWDASARIAKLNDQHAFLEIDAASDLRPGDVIEFGISHPCTCLDRWRVFFGLDAAGKVQHAYRTYFG